MDNIRSLLHCFIHKIPVVFSQRHGKSGAQTLILLPTKPSLFTTAFGNFSSKVMIDLLQNFSHVVLMHQVPLLRIYDNDKPESLACDEDAERVECGLEMSALMPDIISICFTQPATVDLAIALCGFMKLIIEKLDFFCPY